MAQAAGYSFNSDTVSGSTVRDLAGYFLHGTIVGSAAITTGKYGNGLNCTGGAMQIANVDQFSSPAITDGGLSISAWVKLNTTTAAYRCIASAMSSGTANWALYASNNAGNVEVMVAGTTYSTTTSIRDGAWHHVMFVLDKVPTTDTLNVYVDGTSVLSTTPSTNLAYTGNVTVEAGRYVLSGGSFPLDGIIDDFRWWGDPVESSYVTTVMGAEQIDFQFAIYPFDNDTTNDFSVYSRNLTKDSGATFGTALYGRGLSSTATAAAASGIVSFGDVDRLAITGWLRLDVAPTGSAKPILAINNGSGSSRLRVVVNLDRTITATWVTIYGTYSVTSGSALTVGQWSRFQFGVNPTYVNIRLDSNTQTTTNTSNPIPHVAPCVLDLNTLYIGGDQSGGGQVTFDYVTFTKMFLDAPTNLYWCGPPVIAAAKPANIARGVYEFNENTGTSSVDKSPYANNLTLQTAGGWTTGVQGSALSSNVSLTGPGASKSSGLTWSSTPLGWAFACWAKCHVSASGSRIVVLRNGTSEVAHAGFLSGALWMRLFGAGGTTGVINPAAAPITAETWTHIAGSCNGNSIQFYVNGQLKYSTGYTQGTLLSPTILNVGGDGSDNATADVDSLQLFDTPISGSNVAWLYANPGQFAAGTPVTQSRVTTWNTKARVTGTRALSWDARTVVSQTRSTTWNVSVALVAVTASRATTWNVLSSLTSVSNARATTWRVLTRTTGSRSTTWKTDGPVAPTLFRVKFPTYKMPLGWTKPLIWQTYEAPFALVKVNGEWITTAVPSQELLRTAQKFYLGGYQYQLTSEEAADLPPQYVEAIT